MQPGSTIASCRWLAGYQSPAEVAAMARLLEDLPRPLLVFCRSGSRSANLLRLAQGL